MRDIERLETLAPTMKGRFADGAAEPSSEGGEGDAIFDAVLFPNRSLPQMGFAVIMAIVIFVNFTFGLYFYSLGAWPVLGFCGLDVFLVWGAFRLSYRQGRLREHVRVTADDMWVARVLPSGHETRWRLQPFWTRVEFDLPTSHESQIRVSSKGGRLILGSFLSPDERRRFADALADALARARRVT